MREQWVGIWTLSLDSFTLDPVAVFSTPAFGLAVKESPGKIRTVQNDVGYPKCASRSRPVPCLCRSHCISLSRSLTALVSLIRPRPPSFSAHCAEGMDRISQSWLASWGERGCHHSRPQNVVHPKDHLCRLARTRHDLPLELVRLGDTQFAHRPNLAEVHVEPGVGATLEVGGAELGDEVRRVVAGVVGENRRELG